MELTLKKAKDIDDIFSFAVKHGFNETFGFSYFIKEARPDLTKNDVQHLYSLIRLYMKNYDRKWIYADTSCFASNANTKPFIEAGGFQKIYENESKKQLKEDTDLELARRTLKDYPRTRLVAWIAFWITIVLAVIEVVKYFSKE